MTHSNEHTRISAIGDQARAAVREHYTDIARIAHQGPRPDENDQLLIRLVFCLVAGDIHMAKANELLESEESQQ